jgi:hypothetical protein
MTSTSFRQLYQPKPDRTRPHLRLAASRLGVVLNINRNFSP